MGEGEATYRDVVMLAEKRGEALTECTARMRAIRKSYEHSE